MWSEILNLAIANGIFAALFVALLFYVLRDASGREKKYTETIKNLSKHLDTVNDIKENLSRVERKIDKKENSKKINTKYKIQNTNEGKI